MKKKLLIITALILILTALTLAGCNGANDGGGDNPPSPTPTPPPTPDNISVVAKQESISIHEKVFADFDFSSLFVITVDDRQVMIQSAYLDLRNLPKVAGDTGYVICQYKGISARCDVTIAPTVYDLRLLATEISITQLQVDDGYDKYLEFFEATEDGDPRELTKDMAKNNVKREVGDYTYVVTYQGIQKTLTVHVTEAHRAEVMNTYRLLSLQIEQVADLDVTSLFSLYLDGESVQVTKDMIDASALENVQVGQTYNVVLTYTYKDAHVSSTAKIQIVAPKEVVLNARNAVVFPNGSNIDLTSLFTIKEGDEYVQVTEDMISGSVDYSVIGNHEITLTYKGKTAVATVEVRCGVVISLPNGDTIPVKKGTNKVEYNFANDVGVTVNGTRFTFVTYGEGSQYHIDTTGVDFDTAGTYTVNVKIPYSEKVNGKITPSYAEESITYVVKDRTYQVGIEQDEVVLAEGTTSYSFAKNVNVKVNGYDKKIVFDRAVAESDYMTVYAVLLSDAIDFNLAGRQYVKIAVYAAGFDEEPEIVEFYVKVKSGVKVSAVGKIVFVGNSVYTPDLFTITDGDNNVKVTGDMLEGKVDTYTPGVYSVKITYLGVEATARVVVMSDEIVGTYKTNMTTIPSEVSVDYGSWEEDEGWGDYGEGDDDEEVVPVVPLKDMTISADGNIVVNGTKAQVVDAIDESTMTVMIGTMLHTMYINDGIVVFDPDNSNRLSFSDGRRPLVYFSKKVWDLKARVVVNSGSNYVLSTTNTSYSIDTFKIQNKQTNEVRWFGLYTRLVSKNSADTVYIVNWGDASYPEGFTPKANATSTLTYGGQNYDFSMSTSVTAKVKSTEQAQKYSGTYKGVVNGDDTARLSVGGTGTYTFYLGGKQVFSASKMDISAMKNGGVNTDEDVLYFYSYKNKVYSYKFKITSDVGTNKTFEMIKRDDLFGYYEFDGRYIFLDGYGKGIAKLDKSSYTEVQLEYEKRSNEAVVRFIDAPYDYAYGQEATFVTSAFGNVLNVKYIEGDKLAGATFVNSNIESGAIVTLSQTAFDYGTSTKVKPLIIDAITIITKDGTLTKAEKEKCVDTTGIRFNTAGFYALPITLSLNGESVTAYYSIQIIGNIAGANETFQKEWGSGMINNSLTLTIDGKCQLTLVSGTETFKGFVSASDTEFYCKAYNSTGNSLDVQGKFFADGILFVRAAGALIINDYFASGDVSVAGGSGAVLRKIVNGDKVVYVYSVSATSPIEIVSDIQTIEGSGTENGAVVKVVLSNKEIVLKIVEWGNTSSGIIVNDGYRGTYTCDGQDDLVIDGFGTLTIGAKSGTYTINANGSLLVTAGGEMFVLDVNVKNATYAQSSIKLDLSIVRGKTFSADYTFVCPNDEEYGIYTAVTKFIFLANGKVSVVSTSEEHDSGEDQCPYDSYKPSFADKNGKVGDYQVVGDIVKVTVGSAVFEFKINDVSTVSALVCISSNLDQDTDQGAFKVGEKFTA